MKRIAILLFGLFGLVVVVNGMDYILIDVLYNSGLMQSFVASIYLLSLIPTILFGVSYLNYAIRVITISEAKNE